MDFLIRRYYERLPREVRELAETKIVFGWLSKSPDMDKDILVADLVSDNDAAFNKWIRTQRANDGINDFRIKKLMFSNFRKFETHEGKSYLVSFVDRKQQIGSLFMAGKNGSGKTSIFTALEYLLTPGHTSTILQRNIKDSDHFFSYGNKTDGAMNVKAILANDYKLDRPLDSQLSLVPFFCSDMDLQLIQKENDLQTVFMKNLGLDKVEDLLNSLRNTINNLRVGTEEPEVRLMSDNASEKLPADIFYLGGVKDSTFSQMKKNLNLLAHNKTLREVYADGFVASAFDREKLLKRISEVEKIFDMTKELKPFEFYRAYESILLRYKNVKKLLEEGNDFDADELYCKLMPVETFARDVSEYMHFLYQKFQSQYLERNKVRRREVALDTIMDFDRKRLERERRNLLKKNSDLLMSYPERVANLQKLLEELKKLYVEDKQGLLNASRSLIVELLNQFTQLDKTNDKEEGLDIIEDHGKLVAVVKNDRVFGTDHYSTPAKYYNSFRYKLYCISIKVVMAYMTMKVNLMKAPLIFDDVFTASDFDNTINITKFFEILFRVFENFGLGTRNELQIILFTHDEVVMNSLSDIIDVLDEEAKDEPVISYITGMLLDPKAIDQRDYQEEDDAYMIYSRIN